ncbi:MAG: isoprenylcysteine carboxylmethyltransferase family protein [Pseudorhodoplanes sp.]
MNIATVQAIRKIVLLAGIVVGVVIFAVTDSVTVSGETAHEMIEWAGIVLIVVCILGRTWSSLYIAGRKIETLVLTGPYSVCRNPLYFFSIVGAAGVGAQTGSATMGLICGALAWFVFLIVVLQEERLLVGLHGDAYVHYLKTVPRFFPNPRLWHDEKTLTIYPPRVLMTFADAMVFLLAVPLAELFEKLREAGTIPTLLVLP